MRYLPSGFVTRRLVSLFLFKCSMSLVEVLLGRLWGEVHCPLGKGGEAEAWINRIVVPAASFASRELGRT